MKVSDMIHQNITLYLKSNLGLFVFRINIRKMPDLRHNLDDS